MLHHCTSLYRSVALHRVCCVRVAQSRRERRSVLHHGTSPYRSVALHRVCCVLVAQSRREVEPCFHRVASTVQVRSGFSPSHGRLAGSPGKVGRVCKGNRWPPRGPWARTSAGLAVAAPTNHPKGPAHRAEACGKSRGLDFHRDRLEQLERKRERERKMREQQKEQRELKERERRAGERRKEREARREGVPRGGQRRQDALCTRGVVAAACSLSLPLSVTWKGLSVFLSAWAILPALPAVYRELGGEWGS